MSRWNLAKLGNLLKVHHGFAFSGEGMTDDLTGRPIVVSIGNFDYAGGFRFGSTRVREFRGNYPKEFELRAGDLLVVMTCQTAGGEILGIPGMVPDDGRVYLHNQRIGRVECNVDLLDEGFAYYLFLTADVNRQLFNTASGTKILHTSPGRIEEVEFRVPSVREQTRIARVLGALDDKIAVNKNITEVSRKLAQDHYLNALYQDRAWESRPLGDVATVLMGQSPSGDDCNRSAEGIPLLNGPTEFGNYSPNPAQWTTAPTRLCETGDLLVCVRGSTTGRMNWADTEYVVGRGLAAIRANSSPEETCLIYYALLQGMDDLLSRANGSVFPNLSRDVLRSFSIRWLGEGVRYRLAMCISGLEDGIRAREMESHTLATLRNTLLPQLMSGRLRVKDAEKIVEDHT